MRVALLTALAATGLTMGASIVPAAASYDYPYCLQSRQTGYPGDCSYQSYEQCQVSASGRGAGCGINPRVAFQQQRYQGRSTGPRYREQFDRW